MRGRGADGDGFAAAQGAMNASGRAGFLRRGGGAERGVFGGGGRVGRGAGRDGGGGDRGDD